MTIRTSMSRRSRSRCHATTTPFTAAPPRAAFWVCEDCDVWWGSRQLDDTDAQLLLRAAEPALPWFEWHAFRGWRAVHAAPDTCPECGGKAHKPKLALW